MDFVLYIILGIAIPWAVIEVIRYFYNKYHVEIIYFGTSESESIDPGSIKELLECKKHNKGKTLTITTSEDCDAPDDDAVYHYIYSSYKPIVFSAVNGVGELEFFGEIEIDGKTFYGHRSEHKIYKKFGVSWEPKYG